MVVIGGAMSAINPDSSRGIIDLMNEEWSVEDLQNCTFAVQNLASTNKKVRHIAYEKMAAVPEKASWLGGLSVVKNWSKGIVDNAKYMAFGQADPSSIYSVTVAFDQMAEKELSDQENAKLTAVADPTEKLSLIKQFKERLGHLKANLEHHNVVISNYNKRFLTQGKIQGLGCAPHSQVLLNQIENQRQKWEKLQTQTEIAQTAEKVTQVKTQLNQLEFNIQNGVEINRTWLFQSYPLFLKSIEELPHASDLLERYHAITNKAYLENLSTKIEQKSMELPHSLVGLLKTIGYKEQWIAEKMAEGADELLASIKLLLEQSDLTKDSTPAIANLIKDRMLKIVIRQLNLPNDQAIKFAALFNKLHQFEIKQESDYQKRLAITKEIVGQTLAEALNAAPEDQKEQLKSQYEQAEARLRLFNPPSTSAATIDKLLGGTKYQLILKDSEFSPFMQHLEAMIKALEQEDQSEKADVLLSQLLELLASPRDDGSWMQRNAQFCQFKFNQAQWGGHYILGEGVCRAVNYRWINSLLNNPSQLVTSQEQFDPQQPLSRNQRFSAFLEQTRTNQMKDNPIVESRQAVSRARERKLSKEAKEFEEGFVTTPRREVEQHSPLTSQDRKLQAEYSVAAQMGALSTTLLMPNRILHRDGLQNDILIPKAEASMQGLIDKIVERNINQNMQLLDRSAGILDITIAGASGAHAVGIQVDPLSNIYRFWDVNSGFYNYSSLEELKKETNAYMQEFYQGEYTRFYATQYYKKF
jgi:hypothetical protein